MEVLNALIHDGKNGKQFTSVRCISGLHNEFFEQLGYDGTCPACEAMHEVWDLYNVKMKAEAAKWGIDPQNDPADSLKPHREKILGEMDLKNAEEYVTFPIVIIPTKAKMTPADDALTTMRVEFVTWRKKRYNDAIIATLDTMMNNPGHPAGLFWMWKFSYDTQGKQANARDSAKNAKYAVINDASALPLLEPLRAAAEEKAKEFTLIKAAEVIVANQFLFKEDVDAEVRKIMSRTRQLLQLSSVSGTQQQLPAGQPVGQLGGANPLANFGVQPQQGQVGEVPTNLGGAQPQGAGGPVSFG